jgi:sugar O-acyltransferase (sialic acid O-acetyltransferase NeuD family)
MVAMAHAKHSMKNIIIVGAGNFARELCCWLEDLLDPTNMCIGGFLDDSKEKAPMLNKRYQYPVLGPIDAYEIGENESFVIAIAEPVAKLRIALRLQERGATFFNLIHPTALLSRTAQVGTGAIICPFALISADAVVGDFVTINTYSCIGHDSIIGNGTTLSAHVNITGGVTVGKEVFFGSSAAVLPKLSIGNRAKVGAGAIVMRKIDADTTVYSMPAKKL